MSLRLVFFLAGRYFYFSAAMLFLPLFFAHGAEAVAFWKTVALGIILGGCLCQLGKNHQGVLGLKECVFYMLLGWLVLCLMGSLPYYFTDRLGFLDSLFEGVSGITTNGATLLAGGVTPALALWRSLTQWIGGFNTLLLLFTVLPQVSGEFGLNILPLDYACGHLLRRMDRMAIRLAKIYLGMTAVFFVLYRLSGLAAFDAFNWTLAAFSTGGCYLPDKQAAEVLSGLPRYVTVLCMLVTSGNFYLYERAIRNKEFSGLWRDREFHVFLLLWAAAALLIGTHLWLVTDHDFAASMSLGIFQSISFLSTTGICLEPLPLWPDFDCIILFILIFCGGCMTSLAGGFKVMRFMILFKAAKGDLYRMLHPQMVISTQVNGRSVDSWMLARIFVLFALYILTFLLFAAAFSFYTSTPPEAMMLSGACLSSVGTAASLLDTPVLFMQLPDLAKIFCCLLMFIGRLGVFALLLILRIAYYRTHKKW